MAKRIVNLFVAALAIVAFFSVPFGSKTLFEHSKAIVATREARELAQAAEATAQHIVQLAMGTSTEHKLPLPTPSTVTSSKTTAKLVVRAP